MSKIKIGIMISNFLINNRLNLNDLALKTGIPYSTLYSWKENRPPKDISKAKALSNFMEMTLDELIFGNELENEQVRFKRFLYCEDEKDLAEIVISTLIEEFHPCCIDYVPNGYEALIKLKSYQYELIISDNQMPLINGIDLFGESKKSTNSTTPFVLFTSDIIPIKEEDNFHYISKNDCTENLIEKINKILTKT